MPVATKEKTLEVPPIKIQIINIGLKGNSPLVTHNFSEKTKRQILQDHMGKVKAKKQPKVPAEDFMSSLYIMPGTEAVLHDEDEENTWAEGHFGFPAVGIKAAAVRAATDAGIKMTDAQRAFHIPAEFIEIETPTGPKMRMDTVRVGMGVPDIRFRGEFNPWTMQVPVRFNSGVFSLEKVVNLFRLAGFGVGLGEWRLAKGGTWGGFDVTDVELIGEEEFGSK